MNIQDHFRFCPRCGAANLEAKASRFFVCGACDFGFYLNTATAADLELLPHVGPALAARIDADRSQNGRFADVEELDRVIGIGPRTVEQLAPLVRVTPTR